MILRLAFFSVALVVSSIALPAQQTSPTTANALASLTPAAIPAGIADPEAATRAWLDTMPAEEKARSDAYFQGSYWLILWNFLVTVANAFLLLPTKISARVRELAAALTSFKQVQ